MTRNLCILCATALISCLLPPAFGAEPSAAGIATKMAVVTDELNRTVTGKPVQTVQKVIVPAATGGSWTLSLGNYTTTPLAWNASTNDVRYAVDALGNVGSGNAAVTGSGTSVESGDDSSSAGSASAAICGGYRTPIP